MKWKDAYATGNEEVDRQHKTLFEATDEFREVLRLGCHSETYEGFLDFLKVYSETHFGFEEECMLTHHCPVAEQNKKEHILFLNNLETEIGHFQRHGFSNQRAAGLLDFVDRWLDSHICRVDRQLRDYIT